MPRRPKSFGQLRWVASVALTYYRAFVKFSHHNPHLWFAKVERSIRLHDIVVDTDKYNLVTFILKKDVILVVEDIATRPPVESQNAAIEIRLIQKFESPNQRCDDYFTELKPSEILKKMRRLSPDLDSENIIYMLFLADMPAFIRPLLIV